MLLQQLLQQAIHRLEKRVQAAPQPLAEDRFVLVGVSDGRILWLSVLVVIMTNLKHTLSSSAICSTAALLTASVFCPTRNGVSASRTTCVIG